MTSHEKAVQIIELFGIKPKKVAEIIDKSQSVIYDKLKLNATKFSDEEFKKLQIFIKENAKKV